MKPDARYPNEKFRHLAVQKFGTPKCNRTFNVQLTREFNLNSHAIQLGNFCQLSFPEIYVIVL